MSDVSATLKFKQKQKFTLKNYLRFSVRVHWVLVTVSRVEFNLARVIEAVAEAHPERVALVHRGRQILFPDLVRRYRQLGTALNAAGIGCHTERSELDGHESGQDHVALYLNNELEYLGVHAWRLGRACRDLQRKPQIYRRRIGLPTNGFSGESSFRKLNVRTEPGRSSAAATQY